jgi:protease-4
MRMVFGRAAIGVIPVHGMIMPALPWATGNVAVDERVISAIRAARANPVIVGVVLHVDSPGGSALASDRIHHELAQLAAEKPLVAYFSDVAASGGYYVGAAAHAIVAQPTTITGSIGVVAARLVIQPLLDRLGVAVEVLRRGAHAGLLEPTLPFDEGSRAVVEREIVGTYRAFVDIVARGRKRSYEEIAKVAEGRVWMAKDALEHGLIAELGGFGDAIDVVRERVGKAAARAVPVLIRGKRRSMPLNPPEIARREAFAALGSMADGAGVDLPLLRLATDARHRVLLWSPAASALRGAAS